MNASLAGSGTTVVLLTAGYPYSAGPERNFLSPELPYLLEAFKRVILIPERHVAQPDPDLPAAEVEDDYAAYLRSNGRMRSFRRGASSRLVYEELRAKPWLLARPAFLKRLVFFAGQAELTASWLIGRLHDRQIAADRCILYSYWFDQGTLGAGLAKVRFPGLKVISRAHGYDVYEERQPVRYFPCREAALDRIDRLFPVSEAGAKHLSTTYPQFSSKMEVSRLGVENPGVLTGPSTDGVYRIVSCSRIVPVKRLPLMMAGIQAAAARRPSQMFEWAHLTSDAPTPELQTPLARLPSNLAVDFIPYTSQAAMFEYYRQHCADVFLNVSASEGTPMSIMEAISCGIPVIATAVGGNSEVVSEANGRLLEPNPSPDQIADAVLTYWDEPGERRLGSRDLWGRKYDASRNYPDFVNRLFEISQ